jgi:hypothetical protein
MPAETWIDFEKDILYLSLDFCYVALGGLVKIIESNGFTLDGRSLTDTFLKNLARTFRKSRTLQSVDSGVQAQIYVMMCSLRSVLLPNTL